MQTCSPHRKTQILFLWDDFCLAEVQHVSACQTDWCRTTWFTWDLPFAVVMIYTDGFGWRQGCYLCIWLLYPALYSNALIWHTCLYIVSHYGFLIKNKFPGIFFAVLKVGKIGHSWLFSHRFLPTEHCFSWVDTWLSRKYVNCDYSPNSFISIHTYEDLNFFLKDLMALLSKDTEFMNKLIGEIVLV